MKSNQSATLLPPGLYTGTIETFNWVQPTQEFGFVKSHLAVQIVVDRSSSGEEVRKVTRIYGPADVLQLDRDLHCILDKASLKDVAKPYGPDINYTKLHLTHGERIYFRVRHVQKPGDENLSEFLYDIVSMEKIPSDSLEQNVTAPSANMSPVLAPGEYHGTIRSVVVELDEDGDYSGRYVIALDLESSAGKKFTDSISFTIIRDSDDALQHDLESILGEHIDDLLCLADGVNPFRLHLLNGLRVVVNIDQASVIQIASDQLTPSLHTPQSPTDNRANELISEGEHTGIVSQLLYDADMDEMQCSFILSISVDDSGSDLADDLQIIYDDLAARRLRRDLNSILGDRKDAILRQPGDLIDCQKLHVVKGERIRFLVRHTTGADGSTPIAHVYGIKPLIKSLPDALDEPPPLSSTNDRLLPTGTYRGRIKNVRIVPVADAPDMRAFEYRIQLEGPCGSGTHDFDFVFTDTYFDTSTCMAEIILGRQFGDLANADGNLAGDKLYLLHRIRVEFSVRYCAHHPLTIRPNSFVYDMKPLEY